MKKKTSKISWKEALHPYIFTISLIFILPLLIYGIIRLLAMPWEVVHAASQVMSDIQLQQFTDWQLLGVPSTGASVVLARYAHQRDCLGAREAAIRQAWTERQQLPSLECSASAGWWERLSKKRERKKLVQQLARERFPHRDLRRHRLTSQEWRELENELSLRQVLEPLPLERD